MEVSRYIVNHDFILFYLHRLLSIAAGEEPGYLTQLFSYSFFVCGVFCCWMVSEEGLDGIVQFVLVTAR